MFSMLWFIAGGITWHLVRKKITALNPFKSVKQKEEGIASKFNPKNWLKRSNNDER